ncbi:MAG TPA: hypothetical protein PKD10_08160 [Paracoccaceae bacterium]|nr:hypothetical protein [Paracoccaceae bacterium]HMO70790.1 hypothetical protein [Paracoccaceae bacterium]
MAETAPPTQTFNVAAVVQAGRLGFEAVLLAASLRACDPDFAGRLILLEPQPGPRWPTDPRLAHDGVRALLAEFGAEILPFESRHFGAAYPHGNKIEGLAALPEAPFLFLDTDTLVTGALSAVPFDFDRPSASMRREGTWPEPQPYADLDAIWAPLYARFSLDYAASLDAAQPPGHWQRNLYFNAGWFFHRSPRIFGKRFLDIALSIRNDTPECLAAQSLDPWLDQVALPLAIHALGGGRPGPGLAGLDGDVTCHWRRLPLLYARESDRVVEVLEGVARRQEVRRVLRDWEPARRMIFRNEGRKARALFDRADLPAREQAIRAGLKRAGLWLR